MTGSKEELRQLIAERAYIKEGHFRTPSGHSRQAKEEELH